MNWASMIIEMLARGQTHRSIGEHAGVTEGNVRALVTNPHQQPRWGVGESLIALHRRVIRRYPKIDELA